MKINPKSASDIYAGWMRRLQLFLAPPPAKAAKRSPGGAQRA
ncbi:MAG TPA: hypothetical protein VGB59_05125 [Allosphingosinicella sp.]|jgi:hypothetical protein